MARHRSYFPKDDAPRLGGDDVLIGVIDNGEPDRIPEGYAQAATNTTFRDRAAATRAGSLLPTAFRSGVAPYFGSALFSDPGEKEWLLIAEGDQVNQFRDGHSPREIEIPAAGIVSRCRLVQAFDEVILFRGADLTPWRWGGDFGEAFEEVDQSTAADGTTGIPNGPDFTTRPGLAPVVVNSRLIVPHGRNGIAISDIEDPTRYDAAFNDYNLSAANDDTLAGLIPLGQSGLVALKDQSAAIVSGISSSLEALRLDPVSGNVGCIAGGTAANVGGDVYFLAATGVFKLGAIFESRLETTPVAISRPIERIIRRIHWPHVAGAVAAAWGDYYFLAVPFDGSERNTVILPYNTVAKAWEGVHTFPDGVAFDALHVTDYFGTKRLHGIDYTNGRTHLLYHGKHDQLLAGVSHEIPFSLTTRAYTFDLRNRKGVNHGKVHFRGWNPSVTIAVNTDAANDTHTPVVDFEPDRERYKIFAVPDYDTSNANGDHGRRGRQDYSIDPDTAFDPDQGGGVDPDIEQTHQQPINVRAIGRTVSATISNARGTLAVTAIELEGVEKQRKDSRQ